MSRETNTNNYNSVRRMIDLKLRVAILHSGGPAPGSNRVLVGAAKQFLDHGIPVVGIMDGYENIQKMDAVDIIEQKKIIDITKNTLDYAIDTNSFILRTSRANPGSGIISPDDLNNKEKTKRLNHILDVFEQLNIGMLISIGGDDTLKTANYLYTLACKRYEKNQNLKFNGAVIHVPKTIDNDYFGIPWTFGYFTAAESAGRTIRDLFNDARATNSYHVIELMGRKAGWYTAAASIYAEATKAIIPEDYDDISCIDLEALSSELLDIVIERESEGKGYGIFCIAEGLADKLSQDEKESISKDKHGHMNMRQAKIAERLAYELKKQYELKMKTSKEFKPKTVGYETRQISPNLYDVLLTSQLGVGSFKLFEQGRFGEMVTVCDNLEIGGVRFEELIDPKTLTVKSRNINKKGDFYNLLRSLEACHLKNKYY